MHTDHSHIEIRLLGPDDSVSLMRLSQLDTAPAPQQPVIGGMVGGRLVAARSLTTGESIADPFQRTAEVRTLLAERARHFNGANHNGTRHR